VHRKSPDFNMQDTTRTPARTLLSILPTALLLCGLLLGCDLSPVSQSWDRIPSQIDKLMNPVPPGPLIASQQRGHIVYKHYCQICHGEHGQGDGFNSALLPIRPRNFTDAAFWKQATDQKLTAAISEGGKSVGKSNLMPAWGRTLTDRQLSNVVAFLHTLAPSGEPKVNGSGPPK
jgi:mono/diheme cytochrome c family protein